MGKGFKTNLIIVILLMSAVGVIALGIQSDKKARAKDLEDARIYESKNAGTVNKSEESAKQKAEKEKEDKPDVYGKLQAGKDIKVLVVGDSIGKSIGKTKDDAAWDVRLKKLIEDKYKNKCTIQNISEDSAIAYKGYADIMKDNIKDFDIAIVCYGTSDQFVVTKDQFSSTYEAVIRQLKKKNAKGEIITVLENTMSDESYVNIIKDVSKNYNLDMVDGIAAYNDTGLNENDLLADKLHPNDKGYDVYANALHKIVEKNVTAKKTVNKELQNVKDRNADSFDKFNLVTKYDSNDGFDIKDGTAVNNKDGAEIECKTSASKVGLSYVDIQGGGKIIVYVNGQRVKQIDTSSDREIKKAKIVAYNLKGENTIKIRAQNKKVKILGIITN